MRATNKNIKENYERYLKIKQVKKKLAEKDILLYKDAGHKDVQVGEAVVAVGEGEESARLQVTLNVLKTRNFKFKLFCDDLTPAPCYRFDSDGGTHMNPYSETDALLDRRVATPHFHCYNEDGVEIAYKTEELVKEQEKLLGDYDKAMGHFFAEENVLSEDGTRMVPETLPLGKDELENPLEGVEFP